MASCEDCLGEGSCIRCSAGNYLYSSNNDQIYDQCKSACNTANVIITNELAADGLRVCDHCVNQNPFCEECNGSTNNCTKCVSSTYLFSTNSNPSDYEKCVRCLSTYFYNSGGGKFFKYHSHYMKILRKLFLTSSYTSFPSKYMFFFHSVFSIIKYFWIKNKIQKYLVIDHKM